MRSCSSRHLSATQLDPRGDRLQISSRSSRAVYLDMFQLTAFVTTQRREDKLAPTLRRFFGSVTLLPSGSDLLLCPSFFTLSLSLSLSRVSTNYPFGHCESTPHVTVSFVCICSCHFLMHLNSSCPPPAEKKRLTHPVPE